MSTNKKQPGDRRNFIGSLAASAAIMSMGALAAPLNSMGGNSGITWDGPDPEDLFKKLDSKSRHRAVFDATQPHEMMPFAWPKVFLMTNAGTGTPEDKCGVLVVLRHDAIPYAFEDRLWEKYKFGEVFKADDPKTKAPSIRNPFWKPKPGDFVVPGIGQVSIGINELQDSGVLFCVCDVAMTVFSAAIAQGMKMDAAEVKKDWMAGLLPGITPVPSGVWAVTRAQEHGCSYVFAG